MARRGPSSSRSGWHLIATTVWQQRAAEALGVLVGLVWTVAKVSVPLLVQVAIDRGILARSGSELAKWSMVILVAGVVQGSATGVRRYLAFGVSYRVEAELRHRLFAHLQRLHFAFQDQAQTGQLMSRAATDLQQVQNFLVMVPITVANVLIVAGVTALLFYTDPVMAALALVSLPFLNMAAHRFSGRVNPPSMQLQRELAELSTVVEETVAGIRAVKGFGAERTQARRLDDRSHRVYDQGVKVGDVRATFIPWLNFIPALGVVAVLWYGGYQVLHGQLSIGQLSAFILYVYMLVTPLQMIGYLIAQAQRAVACSQRVDEILATEAEVVDPAHPVPLPPGGGRVRFEQVVFSYSRRAPRPVLDGLDLEVRPGEAVALVGATGSGKSTIARLLPRFYDVDAGRVTLDGVDVRELRLRELRRAIGIVFEETFLFTDTIGANIAFAEPEAPMERIRWAARMAGADEFISELPDRYGTLIGERGLSLSGGQRQRVALARAILGDPRVLILDDATSSVDPTKEHEITEAMREVMQGRTTIVIAHRPATVALADRVVLLEHGRILAEGTHHELLSRHARYREVLARAAPASSGVQEVAGEMSMTGRAE
jgi:ATP-binding cassette subfamily B protein